MAIHGVFGNIGLAFGPMIATFALSYFSWKHAYFFFGLINLIIFFFTLFFVKDERSSNPQNFSKNHLRKNNVNILFIIFFNNWVVRYELLWLYYFCAILYS
ncbi:hypothetical protein CM15mP99_0450 [bacterium]|nr:MAG: hypothetical protein CM15mP99_0450 [bacterium]